MCIRDRSTVRPASTIDWIRHSNRRRDTGADGSARYMGGTGRRTIGHSGAGGGNAAAEGGGDRRVLRHGASGRGGGRGGA
eukprot:5179268-Prymnesium_polylepis.1